MDDIAGVLRAIHDYAGKIDDIMYDVEMNSDFGDEELNEALDRYTDLWTEDGVWEVTASVGTTPTESVGRAAIKAALLATVPYTSDVPRYTHLNMNSRIDIDGDSARAITDCIVVRAAAMRLQVQITGLGNRYDVTHAIQYYDHLVKESDRWRFTRRNLVPWGFPRPFRL